VYVACQAVDESNGRVIAPSTFRVNGQPRPFLRLPTRGADRLRVFSTPQLLVCQLTSGLFAGLQNSVIRRQVFRSERFWDDYRVVEDVTFLVRALVRGLTIGYIDEVHVVYRMHDENSSASSSGTDAARLLPIFEEDVRGFERVRAEVELPPDART